MTWELNSLKSLHATTKLNIIVYLRVLLMDLDIILRPLFFKPVLAKGPDITLCLAFLSLIFWLPFIDFTTKKHNTLNRPTLFLD